MKKTLLSFSFLLSICIAQAQITTSKVKVEQTGNSTSIMGPVGIGTTSTGNGMLTIRGTSGLSLLRLENDGLGNESSLRLRSKSESGSFLHADISLFATGAAQGYLGFKVPFNNNANTGYDLIINEAGNVGVGIKSPFNNTNNYGLHIDRGGHTSVMIGDGVNDGGIIQSSDNTRRVFIGSNLYDDSALSWKNFTNGASAAVDVIGNSGRIRFLTSSSSNGYSASNIRMTINSNGNVGIGDDTPSYKLEVNGTARATTFSAASPPSWPDYVFTANYEMLTLEEVERFVTEHQHLPEVPSEAEVTLNGINLGEMDAKLLQKIEELTLYMIEQNKQSQAQQARIEKLEKELKALKDK